MTTPLSPESFPPELRSLAAKVRDGVRLCAGGRPALLRDPPRPGARPAGERGAAPDARQYGVLQHQPAHQPDQRLRLHLQLQVLQLRGDEGRAARLADVARRDLPPGGRPGGQRRHRVPYRRGAASRSSTWPGTRRCLRGLKARFPRAHLKAFTAIEIGWFARREKLSIEEVLRRLTAAGLGSLPGRRGGDLPPRGARDHLRRQARRRRVDRGAPGRPSPGDQEQLHHALRPRREEPPQGGPPAAAARRCRTSTAASTPSFRSPTTPRTTIWA